MRVLKVVTVVLIATPATATTVRYDFQGVANYSDIQIFTYDAVNDRFLDGAIFAAPVGFEIAGSFQLTPANLPPLAPNYGYAYYNVERAVPAFYASQSAAEYEGLQLGITTDGSTYSQLQVNGFEPDFSASLYDYGGGFLTGTRTEYHANGVVKSQTSDYTFNALEFTSGPGRVVDGRALPVGSRDARFRSYSYFSQTLISEEGRRLSSQVALWEFSGPGRLTVSGAGAVPEPTSWALMLTGFGLVGSTLRKARNRQPRTS